ncbi:MAG: aminotransferase class I/II-fold pyridoxal phosphate-dependent enzyme [Hyphomicrobiaceae bacterium]|nr:aminotransferase class I/II-fold pyridoxal phosphate-dependent enzyme [Hyphomicrobiaceae bacterium]
MTRSNGPNTLKPGEKSDLLGRMRGLLQRTAPASALDAARPAPAFADLDEYKTILRQRQIADAYGVGDPYFRVQEGRSGPVVRIGGRDVLNFSSYDYLGLNQCPDVAAAAKAAIDAFGVSVSASRVVAGERPILRDLEAALAAVYEAEAAAVFVSGHATNVATISTLMRPEDLILYDQLCHSSILVGTQLSGANRRAFPHNDHDALEAMLHTHASGHRRVLIVVEGLYSMDGDLPDLQRLIEIKRRHGAWLMVDEAHALGVLGATGRGIAEHAGVQPAAVDIWMGTLSKTLAGAGGYIAGAAPLIEILKHTAPGFVYSVGLSPAIAGAAMEALAVMQRDPERVRRLRANGARFLTLAREAGLDTGPGAGFAVCPIMVGDSLRAAKLSEVLLAEGLNVLPIIYPAVPMQSARLRFFITSEHTEAQLAAAVAITKRELDRLAADGFGLSTIERIAIEKLGLDRGH